MKSWDNYTDKDNVEFAKGEYKEFKVGQPYKIGKNNETAGYVREEVGHRADGKQHGFQAGEQAYVVSQEDMSVPKDQVKHVAVVYQGSNTHIISSPLDTASDWLINDVPLGTMSLVNEGLARNGQDTIAGSTFQEEASANELDKVAEEYPNADIYVYGQSLGSMNGQYAVASMKNPDRLARACLYEGPNVYNTLNDKQKKQADKLTKENKVFNYVDSKDVVPVGYGGGVKTVGKLICVKSEGYHGVIDQHMWGGYEFDEQGHIKTEVLSDGLDLAFSEINASYKKAHDYAAKGGLSDSEKIMLDAATGQAILQSLASQVGMEFTEMRSYLHKKMKKCDEAWEDCLSRARMIGKNLTDDEITECLTEGGCSKDLIVKKPKAKYRSYLAKINQTEEELNEWVDKMNQSVEKILGTDNQIAGYFGE